MQDPIEQVLGLSHDVAGVTAGPARTMVLAQALQRLVPAEMVGYAEVGLRDDRAGMLTPSSERSRVASAVPRTIARHPIALALRSRPGYASAVRMSDVVPSGEWRRHEVYQALFRPLGFAHELVLPLPAARSDQLRGWSWSRTPARDFSDAETTLATMLRPLLAVAQVAVAAAEEPAAADVVARAGLTAREAEVLGLLPSGMTAQQMGLVLRISPRTVNKHVEHLYEKLGVRDRTSAVLLAVSGRAGRA